ncbi:hypothetical protein [Reyranella sp.]|uniref:hypothetical protein n=2 Tax=Reyranella sp. TaxID=1929291 RepID=UPI003D0DC5BF
MIARPSRAGSGIGDALSSIPMEWLLRAVLGGGCAVLMYLAWPVASGAVEAQKADRVMFDLRTRQPLKLPAVLAAMQALDRAVDADPVAGRRLKRAELLAGAALATVLPVSNEQRASWLKKAEADLEFGLANDPARGIAWAQLASVRQALYGASANVVSALLMSIDTAPMLNVLWPPRLQLIFDNWRFFTPEERERVVAHVAQTWRLSTDRRWFAESIRSPIDELFLRHALGDDQNAQDELEKLIRGVRKK